MGYERTLTALHHILGMNGKASSKTLRNYYNDNAIENYKHWTITDAVSTIQSLRKAKSVEAIGDYDGTYQQYKITLKGKNHIQALDRLVKLREAK